MDAVIVDIRNKKAAALSKDGRVVRIRNAGYEIGQQIELHAVKPAMSTTKILRRVSSGVAAVLAVALIGTGTAYAMPYGTVTLEGESSLAYTINCFDYVLDVQASDEAGETLLAEIDKGRLRHHKIDQAVAVTMEQIEYDEAEETPEKPIRVYSETKNEEHTERLQERMEPIVERNSRPDERAEDDRSGELPEPPTESGSIKIPPEESSDPPDFGNGPEPQENENRQDRPQPGENGRDNGPPKDPEENEQPPEWDRPLEDDPNLTPDRMRELPDFKFE